MKRNPFNNSENLKLKYNEGSFGEQNKRRKFCQLIPPQGEGKGETSSVEESRGGWGGGRMGHSGVGGGGTGAGGMVREARRGSNRYVESKLYFLGSWEQPLAQLSWLFHIYCISCVRFLR